MNLTTHLHLVLRSRTRATIPPLPQYAFLAWCSVKVQEQVYILPYLYLHFPYRKYRTLYHRASIATKAAEMLAPFLLSVRVCRKVYEDVYTKSLTCFNSHSAYFMSRHPRADTPVTSVPTVESQAGGRTGNGRQCTGQPVNGPFETTECSMQHSTFWYKFDKIYFNNARRPKHKLRDVTAKPV
jgi:hypothetical protein